MATSEFVTQGVPNEPSITVKVFADRKQVFTTELTGLLEFGRQRPNEAEPYAQVTAGEGFRVIIAKLSESTISRRHVSLELVDEKTVRVTNLSSVNTIWLGSAGQLSPQQASEVEVPLMITLGKNERVLHLEPVVEPDDADELASLAFPTMMPGDDSSLPGSSLNQLVAGERSTGETRSLINWLHATMNVFQSAASSPDFLNKAAKAVVDIVGLDHAAVLLLKNGAWDTVAQCPGKDTTDWHASQAILSRIKSQKRTFWRVPKQDDSRASASLREIESFVASPIMDENGQVIGALYGDRRLNPASLQAPSITELEAMLVELLSCSVAAGLARLEQEQAAMQARVKFEQFFTPELSRQLEADPNLLVGREAEVSVLFCDIRGFSRISERIGAEQTFGWINEVMGALSDCVIEHSGVLVDYIGDELVAMWGAPVEMTGHADCACNAALAMLEKLPHLNHRWTDILGEPMGLGIGINTGMARVGNTGSSRKFKYGPLGNTVNLASRVQGASKYVQSRLVITDATANQLTESFFQRRLCSVEVVNIAEPVVLYELACECGDTWPQLRDQYEQALVAYENQDFRTATKILGNLLTDHPNDGPTLLLLSRSVDMLAHPPESFSPVWKLGGK